MSYKYRLKARVDDNQKEIVEALRGIPGITVETGHDDILVGYRGKNYWYEIKNRDGKNRKQKSQIDLENNWAGHYAIAHTLDDILIDMGLEKYANGNPV